MSGTHSLALDGQLPAESEQIPGGNHETLPLPIELRAKVLKYLLIASSSLAFRHTSCRKGDSDAYDDVPFLSDREIARQFTILCQVSKQTQREAQEAFFEQNQWTLEISVQRSFTFRSPNEIVTWMRPAQHMSERWGDNAIRRIKYLRLHLSGWDAECRQEMRRQLKVLVGKLKGGKLKRLVVYWSSYSPRQNHSMQRQQNRQDHVASERREEGTRENPVESLLEQWASSEKHLEPLMELRHLSEAKVTGSVTDMWAQRLEDIMTAKDEDMPILKKATSKG